MGVRYVDDRVVPPDLLRSMANAIAHRGPDAEGFWNSDGIGLGHKRLAIIDPTGSDQPMADPKAVVCFNGEVFNYAELRRELLRDGYPFRTAGDTEVLLALHRRQGPAGADRIQGQFVYAVWDRESRDLWIYRDPLGVIPLYYFWDGELLAFASEVKALFPALRGAISVDEVSLKEYLAYRTVPWPNTLFHGIQKLPPGYRLHLDHRGNLTCEAYWSLPNSDARLEGSSDLVGERAVDRLEDAIKASVAARRVADVRVGALLSGGLDSSLIAALMTEHSGRDNVETFSAGFDDPRYDELPHARDVSTFLGTRHHELIIRPSDFQDLWSRLSWHRDAPLSEPSELARFKLAEVARNHVKVLLCGEGADEIFAGYPKYVYAGIASRADRLPVALRQRLFSAIEGKLPASATRLRIMIRAMGAAHEADRMQGWFAPFTRLERDRLVSGSERDGHIAISTRARGDLIQRMLYFDCHTWLVDNLLESLDRMSMAASVEARPPFLDRALVELAFALPSSVKVKNGVTKWVLREVARRHLPSRVVDRPKVGFRVPLDDWFRGGLREMAHDLLLRADSFVTSRMSRPFIETLLSSHDSKSRDEGIRIWTLLGIEVWHDSVVRQIGRRGNRD